MPFKFYCLKVAFNFDHLSPLNKVILYQGIYVTPLPFLQYSLLIEFCNQLALGVFQILKALILTRLLGSYLCFILSSLRRWDKSAAIQELFSFLRIGTKQRHIKIHTQTLMPSFISLSPLDYWSLDIRKKLIADQPILIQSLIRPLHLFHQNLLYLK